MIFLQPLSMKSWGRFLITVLVSFSLVLRFDFNLGAQIPPVQLVPHAQREYQLGNYTQAIHLLEQAQQAYQNQPLQQAQVLALTSLAQQQLGRWQPARKNIDASLALIESLSSSKSKTQVLGQIWNIQGHYYFSRDRKSVV